MNTIYSYIQKASELYDAHIHLFDHSGSIFEYVKLPKNITKVVGFMDVDFENLEKYDEDSVIWYYTDFINNHYDKDRMILLATAPSASTMIELYKCFPDIIKGFGEVKCYKEYKGGELPFGNLDWVRELCEFDKDLCLPIYLHWYCYDNQRAEQLEKLISDYPQIPFVLCHAGLSPKRPYRSQFDIVQKLLVNYTNLFADISYEPMEFFISNSYIMNMLPNKFIVGSDINIKSCKHNIADFQRFILCSKLAKNNKNVLKNIFKT